MELDSTPRGPDAFVYLVLPYRPIYFTLVSLTIISWNVRVLNSRIKLSLVFNHLKTYRPVICIFQETHHTGSKVLGLKTTLGGPILSCNLLLLRQRGKCAYPQILLFHSGRLAPGPWGVICYSARGNCKFAYGGGGTIHPPTGIFDSFK